MTGAEWFVDLLKQYIAPVGVGVAVVFGAAMANLISLEPVRVWEWPQALTWFLTFIGAVCGVLLPKGNWSNPKKFIFIGLLALISTLFVNFYNQLSSTSPDDGDEFWYDSKGKLWFGGSFFLITPARKKLKAIPPGRRIESTDVGSN